MKDSNRPLIGLAALVLLLSGASQWWAGWNDKQVAVQVASLAHPGDIRMLASETCAYCASARAWLTTYRVPFSECTIERDADCRAAYEAHRSPGTPVLIVRGKPQLGFSPERLRQALTPSG